MGKYKRVVSGGCTVGNEEQVMRDKVNIVYNLEGKWILPRLARALVEGLPYARACSPYDTALRNKQDVMLNYYLNDDAMVTPSRNVDAVFFDHPKHNYERALQANHIVAMTPRYARAIRGMGRECDLVIQPTDPSVYYPKLRLAFVGRFKGAVDYSQRKGRSLLEKVAALPFVEVIITGGKMSEQAVVELYRSVDHVIVASDTEGGPMCFTEALRCGVKVIMPVTIGIGELFPEGLIDYPAGNFEALKAVLESLYMEKKRLADLVAKYDWRYWVKQHDDIFMRVARQAGTHIDCQEADRAIVVVATPEVREIYELTRAYILAYANACGARLVELLDCPPEFQDPKYRIMGIRNVNAKRILHMDADCCPVPGAPNLFELCEPGAVYCWNEKEIRKPEEVRWFQEEIQRHTGERVSFTGDWWNPGVMLLDKQHAGIFTMPPWDVTDKEHLWYGNTVKNQPYINWLFAKNGIRVCGLDRKWNCVTALRDSVPTEACVLHFGAEKVPDAYARKVKMAREFTQKLDRPKGIHGLYRCAMVTIVSGKQAEALHAITGQYMRQYAADNGYDFFTITCPDRWWPSPSWWKLECGKYFRMGYDVVLFVDNDIFIKPGSPAIVDTVPVGLFGAFNSYTLEYMKNKLSECNISFRKWMELMGVRLGGKVEDMPFMINGGLWVCWKGAREILRCIYPVETDHYYEQHHLNVKLWSRPELYFPLERKWNYGHIHAVANYDAALGDAAYFVHLNGVEPSARVQTLRRFIQQYSEQQEAKKRSRVVHHAPTNTGTVVSIMPVNTLSRQAEQLLRLRKR